MTDKIIVFVTCESREAGGRYCPDRCEREAGGMRQRAARNPFVLRLGEEADVVR